MYRIYYWYIECPIFNRVPINIHSRRILTLVIITRAHILPMLRKNHQVHLHSICTCTQLTLNLYDVKRFFAFLSLVQSSKWIKYLKNTSNQVAKSPKAFYPLNPLRSFTFSLPHSLFRTFFWHLSKRIALNQRNYSQPANGSFSVNYFFNGVKKNFVLKLSLSPMDFKEKTSSSHM